MKSTIHNSNILPSIDKLAKLTITGYLIYFVREGKVKQICFFLV